MKVIEDNYFRKSARYTCENCESVVEVADDELEIGAYGCKSWTCPRCEYCNEIDDSIDLTEENIKFPQHFSNSLKGVQIKDDEINAWIKRVLSMIDKDSHFAVTGSGNTLVLAYKSYSDENEVSVIVCNNGYYETFVTIPAERF